MDALGELLYALVGEDPFKYLKSEVTIDAAGEDVMWSEPRATVDKEKGGCVFRTHNLCRRNTHARARRCCGAVRAWERNCWPLRLPW